ncbi:BTB/POZ domain-containing protein NPY1 [Spatholobus suberectus]|nr:BTB/POZ domain-containing protein NPY1 [Spatholobus suberectus]
MRLSGLMIERDGIVYCWEKGEIRELRCDHIAPRSEYLEMTEDVDRGNLVLKIEVFLNSSIFRSWKDSVIVLQTSKSLLPWSEDLKIIGRCIDSIASKTSVDPAYITWSYTCNRKLTEPDKIVEDKMTFLEKIESVPKDWWAEDICELDIDLYKRVMIAVKSKGRMDGVVNGEALKTYALRWIPDSVDALVSEANTSRTKSVVETIICLLPTILALGTTVTLNIRCMNLVPTMVLPFVNHYHAHLLFGNYQADEQAWIDTIKSVAKRETVRISTMDWLVLHFLTKFHQKQVVFSKNATVQILVAYWAHFINNTDVYLKSLLYTNNLCASSKYNKCSGKVEIKYYVVPGFNMTGPAIQGGTRKGNICPGFTRVNHGKYAVSDVRAHIGTSNLVWDYFYTTAGVSFGTYNTAIISQLREIFNADWNSPYAVPFAEMEKGHTRSSI